MLDTYSKPPLEPFVIGDTNELYASLFFSAGGLTYDFPSAAFSLQTVSTARTNDPIVDDSRTQVRARDLGSLQEERDMCTDLDLPFRYAEPLY